MPVKPKPFQFRSNDGLTLAGEHAGEFGAPSVIMMHGGGQTRHSWGRAVRELAASGYYVVNLDARGHGDSEWASSPAHYAFTYLADDIQIVIDSLPNRPALVGASMGGLTSLKAIGANTAAIAAALVLVDVVPRVEKSGAQRILHFMNADPNGFANLEEAAAAVAAYNPHRRRPSGSDGLMRNLRLRPDGRLHWHWDPQVTQSMEIAELHSQDDMLQRCRHFRNPALLVRGLRSDIVSDSGIAELRESLPQLEVFDVASAGHMIAGDKNDLFNRAMLDFLKANMPP